ncbi:MAG: ABC transporter permease [Hydrogenophaga sp.]|nr:ABC transporter permease [Hydrogenophaga sp.]
MKEFSATPQEMVASVWRNRDLIAQLTKREAVGRYRGSVLGLAWSFFNPLLMLAVYTFVFSVVFKSRWGVSPDESRVDFALILFAGLLAHGLFSEGIGRAPAAIVSNANYVKKVIFPLEILPFVLIASALFHAVVGVTVLLITQLLLAQHIPLTFALLPLVWLPLVMGTLGVSWFLASLGVYLRDVSQVTGMFSTIMLFVSGIFFPISALPVPLQAWLRFNPLAVVVEQTREVLIFGTLPDYSTWLMMMGLGMLFAWAGFALFQRMRKGFADVL